MDAPLTPKRLAEIQARHDLYEQHAQATLKEDAKYNITPVMPQTHLDRGELLSAYKQQVQWRNELEAMPTTAEVSQGRLSELLTDGMKYNQSALASPNGYVIAVREVVGILKHLQQATAEVERLVDVVAGNENTILSLTQRIERLTKEIRVKDTIIEEVAHERDWLKEALNSSD